MAKRKTPKIIKVPGMNGQTMKVVQPETVDPNRAPLGSALTQKGADDLIAAVADGVKQIFKVFNIPGYLLSFVVPIVEYRKGIAMPDGTTKDDFVIVNGSLMGSAGFPVSTSDVRDHVTAGTDLCWLRCWGLTPNKGAAPAPTVVPPEASPSNLPDVPPRE